MPRPEQTDMANVSRRRQSVRPILMLKFCEMVEIKISPSPGNPRSNLRSITKRVTAFLAQHPSVKTTADLTFDLVKEFEGTLENLSDKGRIRVLQRFRWVCNLAVEWRGLRANPFERHSIPPLIKDNGPKGIRLEKDQIRAILAVLDDNSGTWVINLIYTMSLISIYTGITIHESFRLKVVDGKVRFPDRLNENQIHPELAKKLDAWLAVRRQGKREPGGSLSYGEKFAEDGRTRILDGKEQDVIASMLGWKN